MSDLGPSAHLSPASSCSTGPQSRYVAAPFATDTTKHTPRNRAWSFFLHFTLKNKKRHMNPPNKKKTFGGIHAIGTDVV